MDKRPVLALPVVLGLTLAACGWIDPNPPHLEATKLQAGPFEGQVSAIHADANTVSTERKTSEGVFYTTVEVRPPADLMKLHVGDHIGGKIVVEEQHAYATDVRIIK